MVCAELESVQCARQQLCQKPRTKSTIHTFENIPFLQIVIAALSTAARPASRVRSHCRFRERGIDYTSEYGIKWMSGGTKRQCDRALPARADRGASGGSARSRRGAAGPRVIRLSLFSTAQPLYTRFPIIFGTCFSKVTTGYHPSGTASPPRAAAATSSAHPRRSSMASAGRSARDRDRGCVSDSQAGGAPRVISDCHFAVQLNHFIPGFLSYSVAVFLK
jgi:hypothetical protein